MNHPLSTDLLIRAIVALFPIATDESAASGPARNAEGHLNPQAWSQMLSLFSWFGFDVLPLQAGIIAQALKEDPGFPTKLLSVRIAYLEFNAMANAIDSGMSIGECSFAVNSLRSAVEAMAGVLRESGEAFDSRALPQLRESIDELDEMINKRIETEGEAT